MTMVLPNKKLVFESVLTVKSPLVHSDEKVEVMQRFRREPIISADGDLIDIPVYSGNAIRGMLRRAMALRICEEIGVPDRSLPVESFYLLFSGGFLDSSDYGHRVGDLTDLRELLPHLLLMGGSKGSRILPGHIDIWRGEPICRETAHLPGHESRRVDLSVFDLLTEVSYTRKDDRSADLGDEKSPVQMRYSFEALIPGTQLLHGCAIHTEKPLALGCLADAVATCTSQASLGGRSAIGHGRFTWDWETQIAGKFSDEAESYRAHLRDQAAEIRDVLGVDDVQKLG